MLQEIVSIDKKFERFWSRFIAAIKGQVLLLMLIIVISGIVYGWKVSTFGVSGILLLLIFLYGWRKTSTMLYALSIDDEFGIVEIRTVHYNTVKVAQFEKKRVKVNVMMEAFSRFNMDMIRIDVDRKTYFTQKQRIPWTADKIEQAKNFPK